MMIMQRHRPRNGLSGKSFESGPIRLPVGLVGIRAATANHPSVGAAEDLRQKWLPRKDVVGKTRRRSTSACRAWKKALAGPAVLMVFFLISGMAGAAPSPSEAEIPPSEPTAAASADLSRDMEISPEQAVMLREEMLRAVFSDAFRYRPVGLPDPFVPFIKPETTVTETYPEKEREPSPVPMAGFPVTPLQRMSLGEIERGLKAILWGEMGSRALIQDAAGKGYIVREGTPVTPDGLVERIYKDAMVVRQYAWDAKEKQWVPNFVTVQLRKEEKEK